MLWSRPLAMFGPSACWTLPTSRRGLSSWPKLPRFWPTHPTALPVGVAVIVCSVVVVVDEGPPVPLVLVDVVSELVVVDEEVRVVEIDGLPTVNVMLLEEYSTGWLPLGLISAYTFQTPEVLLTAGPTANAGTISVPRGFCSFTA